MNLPLKWEFAGGKIEVGESEIDCIKREILEELNIQIYVKERLTPVIHQYSTFKIKLIPFTAEYLSGDLKLKEDRNFVLATNEELSKLDWAEAHLTILKEYLAIE